MPPKNRAPRASRVQTATLTGGGLQVHLPALPHPPLEGFADKCALIDRGTMFELAFYDSSRQATVTRLSVAPAALFEGLLGTARDFLQQGVTFLSARSIVPAQIPGTIPPQIQLGTALPANVFRLSRMTTEAEFEAYHISPGDLARAKNNVQSEIPVNPVSKVMLPLDVLVGLLVHLSTLEKGMGARLGWD